MYAKLISRILSLVCGLSLTLLAACGNASSLDASSTTGNTPAKGTNPTHSSTAVVVPETTPGRTETNCPAQGQARAAIMPGWKLGPNANIVFFEQKGSQNTSTGIFKRYDVKTSTTSTILELPGMHIDSAQLSADGQWLLFTGVVSKRSMMQLVRLDGKYLQTLYCASQSASIASWISPQWSPDQRQILFAEGSDIGAPALKLLQVVDGKVQPALKLSKPNTFGYAPRTWLDNNRVYLTGFLPNSDAPPQNLYILDIRNGADQPESKLQKVLSITEGCWGFDSTYNAQQLFVSHCVRDQRGSGRVDLLPPTGGKAKTIFSSTTLAIADVRVGGYNDKQLLLSVSNSWMGTDYDLSQDGLWLINSDGRVLVRLTEGINGFNRFTQYPWSNFSRDDTLYSASRTQYSQSGPTHELYYGSLEGKGPQKFAGGQVTQVGWTSL
jgi:hypothetical protein